MMLKQVVLVQFFLIIVLSSATLILQVPIFKQKSLVTIWKQSPPLSLFLGSTTLLALQNFSLACQWILFAWDIIENVTENTFFLSVVAHVGLVLRHFHNCVTVGLFAQRIFYLLRPLRSAKNFNFIVLSIMFLFFIVDAVGATYYMTINSKPISMDGRPVPEGCFSFNCMSTNGASVRLWSSIFTVALTSIIMVLGSLMLFLLHRYRKRKQAIIERSRNSFATYVFYIRFFCETVPYLTDILLSKTAGIDLGKYIGPFGAFGNTSDFTVKTVVYYLMTRQYEKVAANRILHSVS